MLYIAAMFDMCGHQGRIGHAALLKAKPRVYMLNNTSNLGIRTLRVQLHHRLMKIDTMNIKKEKNAD
jgi:hypothetical protein